MQQRVFNVSYLATATPGLDSLSNISKDLILIPKGANIISVMLELKDSEGTGEVSVNLSKAGLAFFNNVTLDGSAVDSKFLTSSIHTKAEDSDAISIKLESGGFTKGNLVLKVLYFLPSQVLTEI